MTNRRALPLKSPTSALNSVLDDRRKLSCDSMKAETEYEVYEAETETEKEVDKFEHN